MLGKHTDYTGGRSLTAATEQGFRVVGVARENRRLRLIDCGPGADQAIVAEIEIGAGTAPAAHSWLVYPMTVAKRLEADFPGRIPGADLAFSSDLPPAAGLASSSAFVTAVFLALARLGGLGVHERFLSEIPGNQALAGYLGAVESGRAFSGFEGGAGVGTHGGNEDHTAIVCSRRGRLGQYAYQPVTRERSVPMPEGYLFAVGFSGVVAEKTGAAREAYNRASRLASEAAAAWRTTSGGDASHLSDALEAAGSVEDLIEAIESCAPAYSREALVRRARHFAEEHGKLVPAATTALEAGDLSRLGEVVDRSQARAEELLDNQVPETIHLAASARRLGAVAASAFGAGFGGSVWAMVESETAGEFLTRWRRDYLEAFPEHGHGSRFFATRAGDGAQEILPPGRGRPALEGLLRESTAR